MKRRKRHKRRHSRRHLHRPRRRKRSLFERLCYFSRRHPIAIGIILIAASLILFRLSFTNQFLSKPEVFMWSCIISAGLFLGGLFALIAWWKNHVAMFNAKIGVNWKK